MGCNPRKCYDRTHFFLSGMQHKQTSYVLLTCLWTIWCHKSGTYILSCMSPVHIFHSACVNGQLQNDAENLLVIKHMGCNHPRNCYDMHSTHLILSGMQHKETNCLQTCLMIHLM
jgi:hypothetical protein